MSLPTCRKNMKKQSNLVKGKCQDDGLLGVTPSPSRRGTQGSCSSSRKSQMRRRNPSTFVASCLTLLPFACVLRASPTMLVFSPVVLTGPSTNGIPFALSPFALSPFCASLPSVTSLPLSHSWGWGGYPFPVFVIPVGRPQGIRSSFAIPLKKNQVHFNFQFVGSQFFLISQQFLVILNFGYILEWCKEHFEK